LRSDLRRTALAAVVLATVTMAAAVQPRPGFARANMRRQADREVREARYNSYGDIGAA
jgi:hypothetical protein